MRGWTRSPRPFEAAAAGRLRGLAHRLAPRVARWLRARKLRRRLRVNRSGYWYLVLTIAVGVVALTTNNNILFLMESLLLGGLILSGIISENVISGIDLRVHPGYARAGEDTEDEIVVRNDRRMGIYCLEIEEWSDAEVPEAIAFVPRLPGRTELRLRVRRRFAERGEHRWGSFVVATEGPFGFARKLLLLSELAGNRKLWPGRGAARTEGSDMGPRESRAAARQTEDASPADADLRAYQPQDDVRDIVWKLSARGTDPVVRVRADAHQAGDELYLDLAQAAGTAFENSLRTLADRLLATRSARQGAGPGPGQLRVRSTRLWGNRPAMRTFRGREALDFLATVQAEGAPNPPGDSP